MPFHARLAVGILLALIMAQPSSAHAEEQMAWSLDSYESDIPEHADTVILTYGIPETDAVAFQATCGGPDGATPHAIFSYDTIDLTEDQDVVLSLSVGDVSEEVPAKVFGKDAEVGVSGLLAVLEPAAPIWQAMTSADILTYGVAGGEREKLHLAEAAAALRSFTAACSAGTSPGPAGEAAVLNPMPGDPTAQETGSSIAASISEMAANAPRAAASPKMDAVSCDRFGTIKSERSQAPAEITFVNKADGYRGLVWIDTEGTPEDHMGLNQGETAVVPTFQTHAWMITDGPGNCIEMVVAEAGDATFEITAPAPVLGPEND